jgi:hypothetical protein
MILSATARHLLEPVAARKLSVVPLKSGFDQVHQASGFGPFELSQNPVFGNFGSPLDLGLGSSVVGLVCGFIEIFCMGIAEKLRLCNGSEIRPPSCDSA